MRLFPKHCIALLVAYCCYMQYATAQRTLDPINTNTGGTIGTDGRGNPINPNRQNKDTTLRHRDPNEDSITIYYRYLDSSRIYYLDQSINDFSRRFPVPYTHVYNGNLGNAARSYLFNPILKSGFDAGFHAFDVYRFKLEDTRIYQTTRPYTELGYMLGSKAEQMIHVTHTQNKGSNLNFAFEYRFINAPGIFRSQNASHNNFRFNTYYTSPNRRYALYFIFQNNRIKSSENGGVINDSTIRNLAFGDPFQLQTRMGNGAGAVRDPFKTSIATGNDYKDNTFYLRQQYDLGQRDSLVTDSATYRLFYPRFRLQHVLQYTKQKFVFQDTDVDTAAYRAYMQYPLLYQPTRLEFSDAWCNITNEFSIISFPQKNNQNQFLKLGTAIQYLTGNYRNTTANLHNVYALAEYRNRTRNKVWDIEAAGRLYLNGFNAGDYNMQLNLKRLLSKKLGYLELGAENTSRTPSVIFFGRTSFPLTTATTFTKENTTRLMARFEDPRLQFRLTGEYFLAGNYVYFDSLYRAQQESTLFNVLHITAEKVFRLSKHFNLYSEVHLQQATGNPPVNIPLFFTRNRIAYDGNLGFKNLNLSTGIEIRYHTPYKADNYSPLIGQFVFQDTTTISNRPDVNLFLHFRIKTFKAFVRLENLNALGGNYNFTGSHYPYSPMWFRLGIWWGFVN